MLGKEECDRERQLQRLHQAQTRLRNRAARMSDFCDFNSEALLCSLEGPYQAAMVTSRGRTKYRPHVSVVQHSVL